MWLALYLVPAIVVVVAIWYLSQRLASVDPPSPGVRAAAALVAGTLWPVVLVGLAQVQAVRYITRTVRAAPEPADPAMAPTAIGS